MWPHSAQVREVYAGSTYTTGTPAFLALYAMNAPSWAKDQLEWVAHPHCLKGVGGTPRLA